MLKINSKWTKDLNVKIARKSGRVCGHSQDKVCMNLLDFILKIKIIYDERCHKQIQNTKENRNSCESICKEKNIYMPIINNIQEIFTSSQEEKKIT